MEAAKLANSVSCAGKSIIEQLWDELDRIMDILMEEGEPEEPFNGFPGASGEMVQYADFDKFVEAHLTWGETRGQAQGVAYAIAMMTNPYKVDVPAIKEQALERWEARQDG